MYCFSDDVFPLFKISFSYFNPLGVLVCVGVGLFISLVSGISSSKAPLLCSSVWKIEMGSLDIRSLWMNLVNVHVWLGLHKLRNNSFPKLTSCIYLTLRTSKLWCSAAALLPHYLSILTAHLMRFLTWFPQPISQNIWNLQVIVQESLVISQWAGTRRARNIVFMNLESNPFWVKLRVHYFPSV